MTCSEARSLLDDYVDRELPSLQADRLAAHLEVCPACRGELEQATRLREALADLTAPEPDSRYWDEVQDLILARTVEHTGPVDITDEIERRKRERKSFYRSLMAVAASLAIFFTALWMTPDDFGPAGEAWLAAGERPANLTTGATEIPDLMSADEREMLTGTMLLVGSPGMLGGSAEFSAMLGIGPGR